jgi:nickel-dependent lactate racemase
MDDCPLRVEMERWVASVGLEFIVNLVLTADGEVYRAVAGHFRDAQRAGVAHAKEVCGVRASGEADITVVSSRPADADLWQASKALLSADLVTREGGAIILLTPCPEGVGPHPDFIEQCGRDNAEAELHRLRDGQAWEGDPLALAVGAAVSRIRRRKRIVIVSDGLHPAEACAGGMDHFSDLQMAYDKTREGCGAHVTTTIITHGAELLPILGGRTDGATAAE